MWPWTGHLFSLVFSFAKWTWGTKWWRRLLPVQSSVILWSVAKEDLTKRSESTWAFLKASNHLSPSLWSSTRLELRVKVEDGQTPAVPVTVFLITGNRPCLSGGTWRVYWETCNSKFPLSLVDSRSTSGLWSFAPSLKARSVWGEKKSGCPGLHPHKWHFTFGLLLNGLSFEINSMQMFTCDFKHTVLKTPTGCNDSRWESLSCVGSSLDSQLVRGSGKCTLCLCSGAGVRTLPFSDARLLFPLSQHFLLPGGCGDLYTLKQRRQQLRTAAFLPADPFPTWVHPSPLWAAVLIMWSAWKMTKKTLWLGVRPRNP